MDFRYLNGTTGYNILFSSEQGDPSTIGYVDIDFIGDIDNKRSTIEYVFNLPGGPIYWKSLV